VHVELLGRDLGQGGPHALAILDLARRDRDHAGVGEVEPGSQDWVGGEGDRQWRGGAHPDACPAVPLAAFMTARTILPCAPQRHKFPSSASRTSCSLGEGLTRSSATALTTMPEVQYPHWAACSSMNARWTASRVSPSMSPSRVVTSRPSAAQAGRSQEERAWPS